MVKKVMGKVGRRSYSKPCDKNSWMSGYMYDGMAIEARAPAEI